MVAAEAFFLLITSHSPVRVCSVLWMVNDLTISSAHMAENGIANVFWSNIWAVVFPWVVALIFYAGSTMNNLMNYVSLISTIPLNLTGKIAFKFHGRSRELKSQRQLILHVQANFARACASSMLSLHPGS